MIRHAIALALLALATPLSAQEPAPRPAVVPSPPLADRVKQNPDDKEALSAFFLEQFRAINALVRSDVDQAEKTLARLKEQVAALAPTKDESRTLVQRGKTTIRYYEEMIAEAHVPRTELDNRLKANADDLDALTKYTSKTTREILPLVSSNPEMARRQIASAKEFLTGLKARAKEETKSKIDQSLSSLTRLEARIDAAKTRANLVGQKAAPLGVETWINGSPLTDDDLKGKVVLLDFWAVWCGPCIATFPHLREWNEKYADKGLVMIGLTSYYNYDWDAKADKAIRSEGTVPAEKEQAMLVKFAAQHKLTHRLGIGSDYPFSKYYGVTGIPQVVVIDREGVVRLLLVGSGEANAKTIGDLLEKLLETGRNAGD